jgi:hypothetical protein
MRSVEPVPQLTPCDSICLTWIAMQYAIRLNQLQRLLYRYTPEADRYKLEAGTDRLSYASYKSRSLSYERCCCFAVFPYFDQIAPVIRSYY